MPCPNRKPLLSLLVPTQNHSISVHARSLATPKLSGRPSPTVPRCPHSFSNLGTLPPNRFIFFLSVGKNLRPVASHLRLWTLRCHDHSPPRTHSRTQFRRTQLAAHPVFLQSRPARSTPTPNRPLPTPTRLADVVRRPLCRTEPTPRLVHSFPQKTPKRKSGCLESSPLTAPLFRKRLSPPSARAVPLHHPIRTVLHGKLVANHPRPRSACSPPRNFSLSRLVQL